MRIFGGEHDYYDSIMAYGQDPNCIYKRKFSQYWEYRFSDIDAELDKLFSEAGFCSRNIESPFSELSLIHVLFCGKHYPAIQVRYHKDGRRHSCYSETTSKCFYCLESFERFLRDMLTDKEVESFYKEAPSSLYYGRSRHRPFSAHSLERFFSNKIEQKYIDLIHRLHGTPIYIAKDHKYLVNGPLSSVGFAAAVEPYTAYQELDMYISGVLGGQSPIQVEIDDVHRLEAKGFDKITSFRRAKTKNA